MMAELLIKFFRIWAKSGVALGFLYEKIDQYSVLINSQKKRTKILGKYYLDCYLRDHVQRLIYFFGAYEPIESFLVQNILEKNDIVVDAGANIGFYSLLMSDICKNGKIYSFEPVPKNFEFLKKNVSLNFKNELIETVPVGLWNESKVLEFSLDSSMKDNVGSFTAGKVENTSEMFKCSVNKIDELLKDVEKIDFIKMDIEGAELFALQGGNSLINKFRPQFLIEINRKACEQFGYNPNRIASFFKELDYQFYLIRESAESSGWIDDFSGIEQANVLIVNEKRKHKVLTNWNPKKIKKNFIADQY
jgi:FkbM family methyltransferase